MPAVKDKLINIPIGDNDVMNTLKSLPRTPSEAGITTIDVKLKRKKDYKNYVHHTTIDPQKLFQAMQYLKECGNPHYQFYSDPLTYKNRCEKEDPTGSQLLYINEDAVVDEILDEDNTDTTDTNNEQQEEIEYKLNDPIRKFQIDYDQSVCATPRFPAAFYDENKTKDSHVIVFAPGEGKTPENILYSKDWDALAFPMKHPDGKFNLHHPRQVKLTDQYYFIQRLRNVDSRFRDDPSYLFAALAYIEKKQLQRNINISFMRGKRSTSTTGESTYNLENAFSVFDNTSNTPSYHKKSKYEMTARLENLGPFQFFFTVSCADMRWDENMTAILREKGLKIEYILQNKTKDNEENEEEITIVHFNGGKSCLPLDEYLQTQDGQSIHEILRNNVVTATRNYEHRVQSLIKNIVLHPHNPMSVEYYSTKVEFQGRGAGHNHGVLWVDMDKMEMKIHDGIDISDIENVLTKNEVLYVKEVLYTVIAKKDIVDEEKKETLLEILNKINLWNFTSDILLNTFQFFGLKSAFKKFQTLDDLEEYEERAVINFANTFTSVTLSPALVGKKVSDIAKAVNCHRHTKSCRKYNTSCRFFFPKFPVWTTLIASPCKLDGDAFKADEPNRKKRKELLDAVKEVLLDEKALSTILLQFPTINPNNKYEYEHNREKRIKEVLKQAGLNDNNFASYLEALKTSDGGYNLIMARDIDEIYVNTYNPEWAEAWNGNTDLQITLDYHAVITYISEYYTKDDTGTMKVLIDALRETPSSTLKEKMVTLMNTFISHRQMGEAEAVYKIFPDFHFQESNVTSTFVNTNRREERTKFLLRVDNDEKYTDIPKVTILGREGKYVEKYDIISKYERRSKVMENICLAQFAKMYSTAWKDPGYEQHTRGIVPSHANPKDKLHFFITSHEGISDTPLPSIFKLRDLHPDEPPYMKKRTKPAVMRLHKFNKIKETQSYWFSELLLYMPHREEEEINKILQQIESISDDIEKKAKYMNVQQDILIVKKHVMEHLQSMEEAMLVLEESVRNKDMEAILNPEWEQDILDCNLQGPVPHPDFDHIDPEYHGLLKEGHEEGNQLEKTFQPIALEATQIMWTKTRKLDYYQRVVVEKGIRYARDLVKSLKDKNPLPKAPLMMVNGGAGCGKSTVINILKQWLHLILHKAGDNPECPHVLVTAPTGTAACKIRGQTLHTTFGFHFGNQYYPLTDKKRDNTRTQLKNLRVVIVDEISMVKADMLYMLDYRLREIMIQPDKIFGGLAIFFFGDLMQLKPCQAKYIFDEPQWEAYKLPFNIKSHWKQFEIITLAQNHRQGDDHEYADLLNRLRVGDQTENDIAVLTTRIRCEDHPDLVGATYICCTNVTVNKQNNLRLDELKTPLLKIEAINYHPTIPNFEPKLNAKGTIGNTAFLQTLRIKIGARVMLIHNLDTLDGLTNGSRGFLAAVIKDQQQKVVKLMVKLDEEYQGANKRNTQPQLQLQYPACTPIEKVQFTYSLSKKQNNASSTATVYQFPLVVCYAATCHKFQGHEIPKPQKAAIDLTTVFQPAMGYVMLSRVTSLEQLYIINSLPEKKLYPDTNALRELRRMENVSINTKPTEWEKTSGVTVKVVALNCHSLLPKLTEIKADPILAYADILCISETWLSDNNSDDPSLQIDGFRLHLNNVGRGKGLATYCRPEKLLDFTHFNDENMQITKIVLTDIEIINIYITVSIYKTKANKALVQNLVELINPLKTTLICGDFNICFVENNNNHVSQLLHGLGFTQIIQEATHFEGGHLDHAYFLNKTNITAHPSLYSSYYTAKDHDALLITLLQVPSASH